MDLCLFLGWVVSMELIVDLELLATSTTAEIFFLSLLSDIETETKIELFLVCRRLFFLSCLCQFQQEALVLFDRLTDNFFVLVSNAIATF